MKKYIKYVVLCFIMFFSFNSGVKAGNVRTCEYSGLGVKIGFAVTENGVTADGNMGWFEAKFSPSISGINTGGSDPANYSCPSKVYLSHNGSANSNSYIYLSEDECKANKSSSQKYCTGLSFKITTLKESSSSSTTPSPIGPGEGTWEPPGGGPSIFTGSCPSNSGIINLLGGLYSILKIAAPIALVIFGMIDFAKAVSSNDEGKMKKAQSAFVRRVMAAIVVLLVMSLLSLLSKLIPSETGVFECVKQILK